MLIIAVIDHENQRYDTVGDWFYNGNLESTIITVSDTGNLNSNCLIGIHELIELTLCQERGITEKIVDQWDLTHLDSDDPGSLEGCPYKKEHDFATKIEMLMAEELGITWAEHEHNVDSLSIKE